MGLVADAVCLNKGTLYHYYPSKSAILHELLSDHIDETLDLIGRVPPELPPAMRLREFVRLQVEHVASMSDELVVFFQELPWIDRNLDESQAKDLRRRIGSYRSFVEGLLDEGAGAGELRAIDAATIHHSIVGMLAYVPTWFHSRTEKSKAAVINELTDFVMAGITAPSHAARHPARSWSI